MAPLCESGQLQTWVWHQARARQEDCARRRHNALYFNLTRDHRGIALRNRRQVRLSTSTRIKPPLAQQPRHRCVSTACPRCTMVLILGDHRSYTTLRTLRTCLHKSPRTSHASTNHCSFEQWPHQQTRQTRSLSRINRHSRLRVCQSSLAVSQGSSPLLEYRRHRKSKI